MTFNGLDFEVFLIQYDKGAMFMKQLLDGALVASAASLGLNWVYNIPYLKKLSAEQPLAFMPVDPAKYKRARKAVMGYPNATVGDVSLQGRILSWVYDALKEDKHLQRDALETIIYDHIKPGGDYQGWVESYGKKLIVNRLNQELETDTTPLALHDSQLVGFTFYLAAKTLDLSNDQAFGYAKMFTDRDDYLQWYAVFDQIIEDVKTMSLKEALRKSLDQVPKDYRFKCAQALHAEKFEDILKVVNTACDIEHAIPVIYTVLALSDDFKSAVELNTLIGGASSDRGLLLGAVLASAYDIPEDWQKHLK